MKKSSDDDGKIERHPVSGEWDGSRLDRFIRARYPGTPFSTVQMLIRKGRILVNGKRVKGNVRLKDGDTVETGIEEFAGNEASPGRSGEPSGSPPAGSTDTLDKENFAVSTWGTIGREVAVLYEDTEMLVLNKPSGIVVQPGNRKTRGSLLDLLEEYRLRDEKPGGKGPIFPYTPVHRLDRETTGVLVVAKTRPAARTLSRNFAGGLVEKVYLAVVEGTPSPGSGTVSTPLSVRRKKSSRTVAAPNGKKAHTSYTIIKTAPGGRSLLEVRITTGRTHQIRAHLASIGHPVAGDRKYGSRRGARQRRVLLHAWKIRLTHPVTGSQIEVTVPPPEDVKP